MIRLAPWCFALLTAALAAGCGTQERVVEEPLFPPPAEQQSAPPLTIETRTDTVATMHTPAREAESAPVATSPNRFRVQIGAYHDPQRAAAIQNLARERFAMPAGNEYDKDGGTYRIRLGAFETRKEAEDFRKKLQREFPGEYTDAWIISPGADN